MARRPPIDDTWKMPTLLLSHHRNRSATRIHHTVQARIDDSLKILRTHLLKRRQLPITGVVHQNIQPPISVDGDLDGRLCLRLIANFQPHRTHTVAILFHQRLQLLWTPRASDYAVPRLQGRLYNVAPQPVPASCNKPDLSHMPDPPAQDRF
jgi:hypothetical protein